jgi:hypothetical protein
MNKYENKSIFIGGSVFGNKVTEKMDISKVIYKKFLHYCNIGEFLHYCKFLYCWVDFALNILSAKY